MKILGVIPARYASSRYPGKPLVLINEKTMIQHVWDRCVLSQQVTEWVVATDDHRIEETVLSFGGKVVMTSDQAQSGTDRCAEVIQSKLIPPNPFCFSIKSKNQPKRVITIK